MQVWPTKYPDSNTTKISVSRPEEEDVENKKQWLSQEIKRLKQKLEAANEARVETETKCEEKIKDLNKVLDQRTNGLLKLKMETESAQTDKTIETSKRETELNQKL